MINRWLRLAFSHIDTFLLTSISLLMLLGLFILFSASGQKSASVISQASNIAVALAIMWAVASVNPQRLLQFAVPLYAVGVVLLVGVALFGHISHGARRWLDIGPMHIQPSEIMRTALPLMLAWYFERREGDIRIKDFIIAALLLAVPAALIAKQPDLGTALLVTASGFYVLFFAGLSWRIMGGMAIAFAASLPVIWSHLHDYQRQRVLTLIDPMQDPLGTGYHTIQATIAIGSGGVVGKGWLHGTQTHLDFLPEATTDFIFAVFGEEFGLIGNILLLTLFLIIIARGLVIASNATSLGGRLLAGSITMTFFTYAFVNMGMVSGILPVVGVPLPMVSYGGTSLVSLLLGFGILMSIQTHRKLVKT